MTTFSVNLTVEIRDLRIDFMEARADGSLVLTKSLQQALVTLRHLDVGIGPAETAAREPCPQGSETSSKAIENAFITGHFLLFSFIPIINKSKKHTVLRQIEFYFVSACASLLVELPLLGQPFSLDKNIN